MPTLEARGVELGWDERGDGAPVVLVHETGTSAAAWEAIAEALAAAGARAISYDRRGWGASSAPDGYRRTTIEEHSEDAAELIVAAAAAPAVVCGAGTSAVIALDLALRRPELVAGSVLVEPPLLGLLPEATERLSADLATLEGAAGAGAAGLVELYLSGGLGALASGAERLPAELTEPARERPVSLVAELGAVPAWGMPFARLSESRQPATVITAGSTPPLLSAAAAALGPRLAGSRARTVEAGDLPPHLGAPTAVAGEIVALAGKSWPVTET
ncbi:MAG TPA: alpha/beta hydrolase [Solirubrobacterales bacterium]|jgi:pimeloyl-ACP methyl ester carboxylesterase|nr:alpha/beta hydrolase [Solirubrobacterales bacterium]